MNIPRFLNLKEAADLLGGSGWLSELLEAVQRHELKATLSGYSQEWTDRIETADLRAYLVKHHGSDLLVKIEETPNQRTASTVSGHGDHISKGLELMNRAALEFWWSAERDDTATHPNNADVSAWLQKQGLSKSAADNAASLIRPHWAATGRKPGER